jgi:hypothetical protein
VGGWGNRLNEALKKTKNGILAYLSKIVPKLIKNKFSYS